jgi:hypothetical protein
VQLTAKELPYTLIIEMTPYTWMFGDIDLGEKALNSGFEQMEGIVLIGLRASNIGVSVS